MLSSTRMPGENSCGGLSASKYWPKSDNVPIQDWCWEQKLFWNKLSGSATEHPSPLFTLSLYSDPFTP